MLVTLVTLMSQAIRSDGLPDGGGFGGRGPFCGGDRTREGGHAVPFVPGDVVDRAVTARSAACPHRILPLRPRQEPHY